MIGTFWLGVDQGGEGGHDGATTTSVDVHQQGDSIKDTHAQPAGEAAQVPKGPRLPSEVKALDCGSVGPYWESREAQRLLQPGVADEAKGQSTSEVDAQRAELGKQGQSNTLSSQAAGAREQADGHDGHVPGLVEDGDASYTAARGDLDLGNGYAGGSGLQNNMELTAEMLPPDVYGQPRKFVPSVPALRPTHVTSTIPNVAYAVVEGPAR